MSFVHSSQLPICVARNLKINSLCLSDFCPTRKPIEISIDLEYIKGK